MLKNLNGFVVGDAREGRLHVFEFLHIALQGFQLARAMLHDVLHDLAHQAFTQGHHVFEVREGGFRLQHPEFREVPAGFGFLGAKRGTEAIHFAQRGGGGLDVELPGLGKIGLLVVDVVHFKEGGGAFASRRGKHRRVGKRVADAIHVIARCVNGLRADAQDRRLPGCADPQVALIEEEIDAVFLELDGEWLGGRYPLQDFDRGNVHFKSAGGAWFCANDSGDAHARFLGQPMQRRKRRRLLFQRDHTLDYAGAVAKNRED